MGQRGGGGDRDGEARRRLMMPQRLLIVILCDYLFYFARFCVRLDCGSCPNAEALAQS
jgi:hypothetical protein